MFLLFSFTIHTGQRDEYRRSSSRLRWKWNLRIEPISPQIP